MLGPEFRNLAAAIGELKRDGHLEGSSTMGNVIHETRAVQVWVDVDEGIADMVAYLNTIPGVRTHASCQGTIGEGGAAPYRPYVMATWPSEANARLRKEFDVTEAHSWGGYLHPR